MDSKMTENLINLSFEAVDLFQISWLFKFLVIILISGYMAYALILLLRVRILNDTIKTTKNRLIMVMAAGHFIGVFVASLIGLILIILI